MSSSAQKVKPVSLDELLGGASVKTQTVESEDGKVVSIPLKLMHPFESHPQGHPFRVLQDARMAETVESIKTYGVLQPGIIRKHKKYPGEYEIISGHRRHLGCQLAGLSEMPVIIKDLTDEEAIVIMVDSNLQREDLLPSEKAWAYRMKYDALKDQGNIIGGRSDTLLAKEANESRNTIQRYIRLTYLIPELLQMVDDNKLPKITAADISFLKEEEQEQLLEIMHAQSVVPSGMQAEQLKELSKAGKLKPSTILRIMIKKENPDKFTLKSKEIRKFFPETYTGKEIEETIFMLLQEWQEKQQQR